MRRIEVLNTLFMQQITSLMSTGESSPDLLGRGITVSKVKVSNDFSRVNVYWIASGTETDEVIEPLLVKAGFVLRHELTQLRVIGQVPPIEFVKDKTFSKIAEVQMLLEKCDFGDDFVPTSPKNYFSQMGGGKIGSPLSSSPEVDESDQDELDSGNVVPAKEIRTEADLYTILPCKQDMLGVRHDVICAEVCCRVSILYHIVSEKKSGFHVS
jgi:ribosome-binding factor A